MMSEASGQTPSAVVNYREVNVGVAFLGRQYTESGMFPGASYLWGRTTYSSNGLVVDRQAGIALPTIVTGKIGVGYGSEKGSALVGIRPWPPTGYLQGNIPTTNGMLCFTAEVTDPRIGFSSIFTAAYRWKRKDQ